MPNQLFWYFNSSNYDCFYLNIIPKVVFCFLLACWIINWGKTQSPPAWSCEGVRALVMSRRWLNMFFFFLPHLCNSCINSTHSTPVEIKLRHEGTFMTKQLVFTYILPALYHVKAVLLADYAVQLSCYWTGEPNKVPLHPTPHNAFLTNLFPHYKVGINELHSTFWIHCTYKSDFTALYNTNLLIFCLVLLHPN